ncbi:MAG: acetoin utilization protein AcuC [Kiritimatiellia bacterium]|jgi:acetoin utilization protein AcuC|nr:acetoin utilization protein AcuC [Kiritimatiellia bacterium]MDP6629517.1 acetoin utilization protein AcuC [Kiritimatiellia bacterium]MDP6809224.1 acetoin utilization protein AcuC [Kiritimatiellia bacterium]MDP7022963.1 acetoin utilization protein AcuC [Kiritimatiellia bacterium]
MQNNHIFIHSDDLNQNGYPPQCPFNTSRASRALSTAESMGLLAGDDREVVAPVRATRGELEAFHTAEYLDAVEAAAAGTLDPFEALNMGLGTPDCPVWPGMMAYLTLAAGASITGARWIIDGKAKVAFNPSGGLHHAHAGQASGFCYLNDLVMAANAFLAAGKRVLFLDVDVHHGDGVQKAFYSHKDVMTVSMHESGHTLFPGTGFVCEVGEGKGVGYSVNVPLPVGTYDAAYRRAFDQAALPLIKAFDPDVIIMELGMDTLSGDPLAHMQLTNNTPADIVETVVGLDKPMLATGGGGYHLEHTVRAWALCWGVLCGDHTDHEDAMLGMGGVMMGNTDWFGGLRDRVLLSDAGRRDEVDTAVDATIAEIKRTIFPLHGI